MANETEPPSGPASDIPPSTENADAEMRLQLEFHQHNWLERQLLDKERLKKNDQQKDDAKSEASSHKEDKKSKLSLHEGPEETVMTSSIATVKDTETSQACTSLTVSPTNPSIDSAHHNVIGIVKPFQRHNENSTRRKRLASGEEKPKLNSLQHEVDGKATKDIAQVFPENISLKGVDKSLKAVKETLAEVSIEKYYSLAVYPVRRNGQALDLTSKDKTDAQQCGALDLTTKNGKFATTTELAGFKNQSCKQDLPPQVEKNVKELSNDAQLVSPKSATTVASESRPFVVFSSVNSQTKSSICSMTPRANENLSDTNDLDRTKSNDPKVGERNVNLDENKLYDIVRIRSQEPDVTAKSNLNLPSFQSSASKEVMVPSSSTSGSVIQPKAAAITAAALESNPPVELDPAQSKLLSSTAGGELFTRKYKRSSLKTKKSSISSSSTESIIIDVDAFDDHIEKIHPRPKKLLTASGSSSDHKPNFKPSVTFVHHRRRSNPEGFPNASERFPNAVVSQSDSSPSLKGLFREVEKEVQSKGHSFLPSSSVASFRNAEKDANGTSNNFHQHISPKFNRTVPNGIPRVMTKSSIFHPSEKNVLDNKAPVYVPKIGHFNPQLSIPPNVGHRSNLASPLLSPHSGDVQRHQRNENVLRHSVKPHVSGYTKIGAGRPAVHYPPGNPVPRLPEPVLVQSDHVNQHHKSPVRPTPVRTQQVAYQPQINRFPANTEAYISRSYGRKTEHPSGAVAATAPINRSPSRLVAFGNGPYMPRPSVIRAPPGGVSIASTPIVRSERPLSGQVVPRQAVVQRDTKRIPEIPMRSMTPPGLHEMSNEEAARFAVHLNAQKAELENQIRKLQMLESKIYAPRRTSEPQAVKHIHQEPTNGSFLEARKRKASSSHYTSLPRHQDVKMVSPFNPLRPPPHKIMMVFPPAPQGVFGKDQRPVVEEKCGVCRKKAFFVCSGCRGIWYCSKACQFEDWTKHNQVCS